MNDYRLTSSPWGFRETVQEEQCRWLKDNGLKYICGQFHERMPGLFSRNIPDKNIDETLRMVDRYGLQYASFNVNGDFTVYENIDAQIKLCCREIDKAARFKPEVLIVFAGWVERDDEAVYQQVSDALKRVARHAAKYNLTVALENHGGLTATPEQCNKILKNVNEPNIGLNYDAANFEFYGIDPLEALKQLEVPIVFTHFKSVRLNADGNKEYCRLRDGYINYKPIIGELKSRDYAGFWAMEYEETKDVFDGTCDDKETLMKWLV